MIVHYMAHVLDQLSEDQLDSEAVTRTLAGDRSAFDAVVHRYTGRIYSLTVRFLENISDAEEATQDIFLKAYRALPSFDTSRRFFTWLYSIALNHLRSMKRRRHSRRRIETVALSPEMLATLPAASEPGPEQELMAAEAQAMFEQALAKLRPLHRRVFVLRQVQGLSAGDTAAVLDVPENTVKTHLRRARSSLARMLAGDLENIE